MFEAKSIYLGGSIVESLDCDYNSYKELGLTCPFCNSAVHLRKGSTRTIEKSGKIYSTRPYFSHYSVNNEDGLLLNECERRVQTKEGREIMVNAIIGFVVIAIVYCYSCLFFGGNETSVCSLVPTFF